MAFLLFKHFFGVKYKEVVIFGYAMLSLLGLSDIPGGDVSLVLDLCRCFGDAGISRKIDLE